jgi:hypothetical protein
MNYKKIYNNIIENAKLRKIETYCETHHIIPKCLGGTDDKNNLVELTAREHYLCHWLLAKYTNDRRLWLAFSMMGVSSKNHDRIWNSRVFERSRIARKNAMTGSGNHMFGKKSHFTKHTEETKEKIRISKLGKKRTKFSRRAATEETKIKISNSKKGKPSKNKGVPMKKIMCPHCSKSINSGNYSRWHGDNCKNKVA